MLRYKVSPSFGGYVRRVLVPALFAIVLLGGSGLAAQNTLTTTFAGGSTAQPGQMFDLTVGSAMVNITRFDCHTTAAAASAVTYQIYYRVGGYAGFEQNSGAWTLHDTVNTVSAGQGNPTVVTLNNPLQLNPATTYGMYVTTTLSLNGIYTSGANTYSDSYISITTGTANGPSFGSVFTPRTWNGTIYYNPVLSNSTILTATNTAGNIGMFATNAVVMDMTASTFVSNNNLNSVTFTKSGTVADSSITNVTLWRDVNNNGVVDTATDVSLGSGTLSGGAVTFSGSPLQGLTAGTPVRMLLGVNVSGATGAQTVQFQVVNSSGISWTGGTDLTSFPVNGGLKTVVDTTIPAILYYRFNENSGTTTANHANPGQGSNPVTLSGNSSWTAPGALGAAAVAFSGGTSGGFSTGWTPNLSNNDSWTMEFWIRGAPVSTNYIIGNSVSAQFRIYTNTNGGLTLTGSGFSTVTWSGGTLDNAWHHVAFVFNAATKTMTAFADGNQVAQTSGQTTAALNNGTLHVGGQGTTTTSFNGSLDDFRLWPYARTQSEIAATRNTELFGTLPTLLPSVGSSFVSPLTLNALVNVPLSNATLVANDGNDAQVSITVTPTSPAPGVIAPSSNATAAVPYSLTWTNTPTATGTYTYSVLVSDGVNNMNFAVTIIVTDVGPTLTPSPGSLFKSSLSYFGKPGYPLANATLRANDLNTPTVSFTVTTLNGHASITPPASQTNVPVPVDLNWTGTPSAVGNYTYQVDVTDGVTNSTFTATINVANGEVLLGSTTGSTNTIPFNQNSARFMSVFGADEINLPAGAVISEIRVAGSTVTPTPEYIGLRLRMAHSNQTVNALDTTFANNYIAPLHTALGPVNITPATIAITASQQWYVFPLSNPFVYNGVDGLCIDWSYDSRIGTGFVLYTTVPTGEPTRGRLYTTTGNYLTPTGTAGTTVGNYGIHMLTYAADDVALTSNASTGSISAPHTNLVTMDMRGVSILNSRTLNSVTFTKTGTIADSAISQVRLVLDANDDGIVNGGDTVLGSGILTGGQITFAGSPLAAIPNTVTTAPVRLLLAVDIPTSQQAGTTMTFQIASGSALTFSGGTDATRYPLRGTVFIRPFSGTYTINQTSGDFTDIGAAFDALENAGVSGPVILEITDSATYTASPSYSLGIDSSTPPARTPVLGVSTTNRITLRAAAGQTPVIVGSASGAILGTTSATTTTQLTGRGGLAIMESFVSVEGLTVTGGPNFGIFVQGNGTTTTAMQPHGVEIRRCRVYDIPSGPGIAYFGQNSSYFVDGVIENNFVYNCFTNSVPATTVIQGINLTAGCIAVRNPATGSGIIRHNTIVHTSNVASTAGLAFSTANTAYAANAVNNNIVYVTSTATTIPAVWLNSTTHASTVANWNFNYWFATQHCNQTTLNPFSTWQTGGRDTNGSNANPGLISTTAPFDLRLLPNSPCINPTGQTSTIAVDFFGVSRPQGATTDIGAHETNYSPSLLVERNNAGPNSVLTALASDQWVASFNAMSVLTVQQVNSVTFTHTGTTSPAGYTNLKLWVDTNGNGAWDATDTQLGTTVAALTGSTVTFIGAPLGAFTAQNQAYMFFLTAQISASATLGTAQFRVESAAGVSASPGPITGLFPIIGRTINVENPAPTLVPATGSNFNSSLVINHGMGSALNMANLVAGDSNNPTIDITVTAINPAPNVTAPASQSGVTVPATLSWTGNPTAMGTFTYQVVLNDGVNTPTFTVTINVTDPPPALVPTTGSGFNSSLVITAPMNVTLANADLAATDVNSPSVNVTIAAINAAPGVTQPANLTGATPPATISWAGTPTAAGNYSYTVSVSDATSVVNFTVTINVTDVPPTLAPAAGSGFNASRVYTGATGVALAGAVLEANDVNNTPVNVTIVAVTPAPGLTQPANLTGASVPASLTWTGTPSLGGVFTYNVTISDGVNNPVFVVTFNIQLAGTFTINQTSGDYSSPGEAFNAIEAVGVSGPVVLEFTDSATYSADLSYSLGLTNTFTYSTIVGLSAVNNITIRAATGQTPVILGSATGAGVNGTTGRGAMAIGCSFVTVEGLTFTGGPNFGIIGNAYGANVTDLTIRRCMAHGVPNGPGIVVAGFASFRGSNVLIENNFVWDCLTVALPGSALPTNMNGSISIRNAASTTVIRHNTILHNSTVALSSGFRTNDGSGSVQVIAEFSNNIIYVTDATLPALRFETATAEPASGGTNYNCYRSTVFEIVGTVTNTFATWQGAGRDANGLTTDPLLVSVTAPYDLHLASNSPCIDPVGQTSTLNVDIDGNSRPVGPRVDIGADEALVPYITLAQGATAIAPNGTINVGNVATTTGSTFTFTIVNGGGADLLLNGATPVVTAIVNNLDNNSGVTSQPATTITPTGSVTFDILLDPTMDAQFTMTVSIANNDFDRDPYQFTINGDGFTPNGDAIANTAAGSSLSGGTNGPFTLAVDPATTLANVEITLSDPENDNITVTSITAVGTAPTGITAPAVPATPGHPVSLIWTGVADASNNPTAYTWEVTFEDSVNANPVTVQIVISINNLAPQHAIANATGGNGSNATPYTAVYTATMTLTADIDLATVTDANTGQSPQITNVIAGGSNPPGNGFSFDIVGGFLNVAPTSVLAAGDIGTHTFDVEVSDGIVTITIAVSITVNAAPTFVTVSPIMDGEQGVAYSFTFVTTGGTGALTFSLASGTLPNGLGLNATTGMITGMPTLAGVYNFSVTITDTLNVTDTDSFVLTIDPPANGNPTITTTSPLIKGRQGDAYGPVSITATGGMPGYSFAVTGGALPPGLSLSTAGVISGTATLQGTYAFTVTVTDSAFATDADAFQITIDPPPVGGNGGGGGGGGGCVAQQSGAGMMAIILILLALAICARLRPTRE